MINLLVVSAGKGWFHGIPHLYCDETVVIKSVRVAGKPILKTSGAPNSTHRLSNKQYIFDLRYWYAFTCSEGKVISFDGHALLSYFHIFVVIEHFRIKHFIKYKY